MGFTLLALIAGAAYFIGRYDMMALPKSEETPAEPFIPLPAPSIDPYSLPATYREDWDAALERYEVEVFPPEAEAYIDRLVPPPGPDGINVASGCLAIAVGVEWWVRALDYGQQFITEGRSPDAAAREVLRYMAPTCKNATTTAAKALQLELSSALKPVRNGGT